jgi:hypothetical protein
MNNQSSDGDFWKTEYSSNFIYSIVKAQEQQIDEIKKEEPENPHLLTRRLVNDAEVQTEGQPKLFNKSIPIQTVGDDLEIPIKTLKASARKLNMELVKSKPHAENMKSPKKVSNGLLFKVTNSGLFGPNCIGNHSNTKRRFHG